MNKNKSIRSQLMLNKLNKFLKQINYKNVICPPHNNDALILADRARNGTSFQTLTGKNFLKQNIEREVYRLNLAYDLHMINLATNKIWIHRLTHLQRQQFENPAIIANNINTITQMPVQEITTNSLEYDFFNGTSFYKNDNLDSLIPLSSYSFL
ncbi:hypothetical protein GLOIN_2v1595040 [Rhizophagus clarus]|uniref:Uncharacterized protein n=1 Tax=Rhizophagus clarus TaxID=94130 RepID=A0A8H3LUU0_9GLOM|nr:hypothetical protein GLOIN_2v1595040 [Rhizophagus clarus]